jgi:hypothetical protein
MFTRDWLSIIQREGSQSAIERLNDIRSQFISGYNELQAILGRRPYYRQDIMKIVDDRGEMGDVNGALNNYMGALKALPEKPSAELIKLAISPSEAQFEKAINNYSNWISSFNTKTSLLRDELEKLMELE